MRKKEKRIRSFVKSISYRILIIVSTALVTWVMTQNWEVTIGVTSAATILNTTIYYFHERIWNKISWGR